MIMVMMVVMVVTMVTMVEERVPITKKESLALAALWRLRLRSRVESVVY
jgi:hypothetical protein